VGIFSRNKSPKEAPSYSPASRKSHQTSLEDKAQIIVEFTQDHFNGGEYEDFFDYNDLGTPLAVAITQEMADLTDSGREVLEETWTNLCDLFDADATASFESIDDLIGDYQEEEEQEEAHLDLESSESGSPESMPTLSINEPLTDDQIIVGVMQIFQEVTGAQLHFGDFDKRFTEDLGIDSLALVEGMIACEDMFDISISNQDAFTLLTASQVVVFVASKRSQS
jgi:acyl carrier protein